MQASDAAWSTSRSEAVHADSRSWAARSAGCIVVRNDHVFGGIVFWTEPTYLEKTLQSLQQKALLQGRTLQQISKILETLQQISNF